MAGSFADFKYLDDDGNAWLLRLDRSNCLSAGTGFVLITQADLVLDYLPRNIEPRVVIARHPTRSIKRPIVCASTSSPLWTGAQETINLIDYQDRTIQNFKITDRLRERAKYTAKLQDTYQNDNPT